MRVAEDSHHKMCGGPARLWPLNIPPLAFGLLAGGMLWACSAIAAAQPPGLEGSDIVPQPPPVTDAPGTPVDLNEFDELEERDREGQPRDPTVPSPEIRQRMLPPPPPTPAARVELERGLPTIPEVRLKAIVMRSSDLGTALLEVEGRTVSVTLRRGAAEQEVTLPEQQFVEYQSALRQLERATDISQDATEEELPPKPKSYTLNLESSFSSGDLFFSVQNFSTGSLLLRVEPLGKFILLQ